MVELYMKKGVDEKSAKKIVGILSKYKHAFVDIMVTVLLIKGFNFLI